MGSSVYKELKERVLASEDPLSLYKECEEYVQGVVLKSISGYYGDFFRVYSLYALSITIKYVGVGDAPAWVEIASNKDDIIKMYVNPLFSVMSFESDTDILFCVAHEVKHVLFSHLLKYKYLLKDDVTQVILNLCLDAEVNESLIYEMRHSRRVSAPSNAITLESMTRFLASQYDKNYLLNLYAKTRTNKGYNTIADLLYNLVDVRCKELLGYSIEEILYRVKLVKTTFKVEIFKVVYGIKSNVFDIKDEIEAKKFCEALAEYLDSVFVLLSFGGSSTDGESSSSNETAESCGSGEGESTTSEGSDNHEKSENEENCRNHNVQSTMDEDVDSSLMSQILSNIEANVEAYSGNLFSKEKGRGTEKGKSGYMNLKSFRTSVPWQNYLERFLNSKLKENQRSKNRINRRQPFRLDISGSIKKPEMEVAVGVDESGSMSNEEVSYCLSEIERICMKYNCSIHLYRFSSCVEDYVYLPKKLIKKGKLSELYTSRYCGGTCFQPVFDAVQSNKDIRLSETLLIMFTDGYGEGVVDFGKVNNRLWIVTKPKKEGKISINDYQISCKESVKNIYPVIPVRVDM